MTSDVLTWIIVALSSIICGDNSSQPTTESASLSPNVTAENALSADNRPGRPACSPSPCHPEAVCVSLGEMTDHVSGLSLTNTLTVGSSENPCDTTFKRFHNIFNPVLLMTGQVGFRCLCPPGSRQVRGGAGALIRQEGDTQTREGKLCEKNAPPSPDKIRQQQRRVYKGTLTGGLLLDGAGSIRSQAASKPYISIVDDISNDMYVNMQKMREEHEQKPEHFGIHLSKLKALENDTVTDNKTEIISDIF